MQQRAACCSDAQCFCAPRVPPTMAKLTTDLLKNALPEPGKRLELRDDDEPGLIFRVTDTGKRSWSFRYRNGAGEQRRKAIGPFPAISLSKAREEARKVKGSVASGTDLVALEQAAKAEEVRKRLNVIGGLAEAYFADAAIGLHRADAEAKRATTLAAEQRIYDRLIAPEFASTAVTSLTRQAIQDFVSRQTRTKLSTSKKIKTAPSNGRHCRDVMRQLLSYAVMKGIIEHNPALSVAVAKPTPRDRVLTDDELKSIWGALEAPGSVKELELSPEMALALQMAAVTLQRGGEVVGMQWQEIDRKARLWRIPADRMKGKRPHIVPLSSLAIELLDRAKALIGGDNFVFQSKFSRSEEADHLDRRSFSRAMARLVKAIGIPHATPHDLRRTGATMLTGERVGIPRFFVSQVIAHSGDTGGAAAVTGRHYDLNDYLPEKRRALEAWAALLTEITEGHERASNVTSMPLSRA